MSSHSSIDASIAPLQPHYPPPADSSAERKESTKITKLISTLDLIPHIEGGYFVETDRDPHKVPNPFLQKNKNSQNEVASSPSPAATATTTTTTFYTSTGSVSADLQDKLTNTDKAISSAPEKETTKEEEEKDIYRNASTTIHYLLTPRSPLGAFHRNKGRTIHTLHRGRGRYVVIHADDVMTDYNNHDQNNKPEKKARVETFVVGGNVEDGERVQWIVEGGKYKSSFLLPLVGDAKDAKDGEEEEEEEGLLISETVVPGFEYGDHDFMRRERLEALVTKEQYEEMKWMLRKD